MRKNLIVAISSVSHGETFHSRSIKNRKVSSQLCFLSLLKANFRKFAHPSWISSWKTFFGLQIFFCAIKMSGNQIREDISAKHIRMNAKFLRDFFDMVYSKQNFKLATNKGKLQKFWRAVEALKATCRRIIAQQEGKATFVIPARKPSANPSTPRRNRSADNDEESQYYDTMENFEEQATSFGAHGKSPKYPPSPSYRTPEDQVLLPPNVMNAPSRPKRSGREGKIHQTPKGRPRMTATNRTINLLTAPRSLGESFQLTVPSPNNSGITFINSDKNLTKEEVEAVAEIIANVSLNAGDEVAANRSVLVTTRKATVIPGRYDLYKITNWIWIKWNFWNLWLRDKQFRWQALIPFFCSHFQKLSELLGASKIFFCSWIVG